MAPPSCSRTGIFRMGYSRIETGLGTTRVLHMKDSDPPSKMQMGPQRMVAGGSTFKSGGSTSKTMHAVLSFSLTQVLQSSVTSSCPRRQLRNFENMPLVARQRKHFRGFLAIFLVAQLSPKRGVLVRKNSLASFQRCRHSVEPRALTCPFKHSDLIAWSLMIGHPTHKYL